MVEGEDSSIDTLMYWSQQDRTNVQKLLVPVKLAESSICSMQPGPDLGMSQPGSRCDQSWPIDIDNSQPTISHQHCDRWFYIKNFVSRLDGILESLQDEEALPDNTLCAECGILARPWRCNDCVRCWPMCRKCMHHTHFSHPFHRIECWTGRHFQLATLWEVGVYLMLTHHHTPSMCATLTWQKGILQDHQATKDKQNVPSNHTIFPVTHFMRARVIRLILSDILSGMSITTLMLWVYWISYLKEVIQTRW